jgi:hypothetical protein
MSEEIKHSRRRFLGTAAMPLAAAQFGMFRSADAQSTKAEPANARWLYLRSEAPVGKLQY